MRCTGSLVLLVLLLLPAAGRTESADELLDKARAALAKGRAEEARGLADKAIALDGKNPLGYLVRGVAREMQQDFAAAVTDYNESLRLEPRLAEALDHRGSAHFKQGKIKESLADFDKFLEARPDQRNGHWRRGITCYYAGAFEEGRKQFEGYEKVDTNDVENAVWHFLCTARASGVEKARASLLKIGKDRRVPMMEVYALFAGKAKPEDVLAAARAGEPAAEQLNVRLFYAHLYLGLYAEVSGDKKKALEHLTKAADDYKIGHYMGDVARVHRDLLRKEMKPR